LGPPFGERTRACPRANRSRCDASNGRVRPGRRLLRSDCGRARSRDPFAPAAALSRLRPDLPVPDRARNRPKDSAAMTPFLAMPSGPWSDPDRQKRRSGFVRLAHGCIPRRSRQGGPDTGDDRPQAVRSALRCCRHLPQSRKVLHLGTASLDEQDNEWPTYPVASARKSVSAVARSKPLPQAFDPQPKEAIPFAIPALAAFMSAQRGTAPAPHAKATLSSPRTFASGTSFSATSSYWRCRGMVTSGPHSKRPNRGQLPPPKWKGGGLPAGLDGHRLSPRAAPVMAPRGEPSASGPWAKP
jgi:hypothetical protein